MSQLLRRFSNRRQDFFFCHGFLQIKKPPGLGWLDFKIFGVLRCFGSSLLHALAKLYLEYGAQASSPASLELKALLFVLLIAECRLLFITAALGCAVLLSFGNLEGLNRCLKLKHKAKD